MSASPAPSRSDAPANTSDYAAVHRSIRSAGHALALAAETIEHDDHVRMDAFVRYWRGHVSEILSHHGIEDDIFFPALRERAPWTAGVLDVLDAEHHQLDELLEECRDGIERVVTGADPIVAARLLHRLADVMDDHLDLEDREIVPQFARSFSFDEYEELTNAAVKQLGLGRQAAFTVPYIAFWCTPEEQRTLMDGAPLPFKVLLRLTRTRHARLTVTALGADAIARARRRHLDVAA